MLHAVLSKYVRLAQHCVSPTRVRSIQRFQRIVPCNTCHGSNMVNMVTRAPCNADNTRPMPRTAPGMRYTTPSLASWEERCQHPAWLLPCPAPRPFERARGQRHTPRTCEPCERPLLDTRCSALCFRCGFFLTAAVFFMFLMMPILVCLIFEF